MTNNCDQEFIKETLSGDWRRVQSEVMRLRKNLADLLFNSSDLRPGDGCIGRKNCSGEGFCEASYINGSVRGAEFESRCAYPTNEPLLEWIQQVDLKLLSEQALYTCNKPSCAAKTTVQHIVEMIKNNYVLPLNVTVPLKTTTTRLSTMSTTTNTTAMLTTPKSTTTAMPTTLVLTTTITTTSVLTTATLKLTTLTPISTSSISTSTKNVARSIYLNKIEKLLFVLYAILLKIKMCRCHFLYMK
ncbi:unnamed protein product [Rotaria sp. Silwood2]|nr:unnamed protein product [Rotaria sp. Silwood2]CAF4684911.1 unnamed protein product [Rotaria sp. Silwood2]